jgi:hypothetical protein
LLKPDEPEDAAQEEGFTSKEATRGEKENINDRLGEMLNSSEGK